MINLPALLFSGLSPLQTQPSPASSVSLEFYPVSYAYSKNAGEISQKSASDVTASYVRKGFNTNLTDFSVHLHPQVWDPWFLSFGANNYGGVGVFVLEGGRKFEDLTLGVRLGAAMSFEDDSFEKKQTANATYRFNSSQTRDDNFTYGIRVAYEIRSADGRFVFNPRVMFTHFSLEADEPSSSSDRNFKTKRDYFLVGSDAWMPINSLLDIGMALDFTYGSSERTITDKSASDESSFKSKTTLRMAQWQVLQVRIKL